MHSASQTVLNPGHARGLVPVQRRSVKRRTVAFPALLQTMQDRLEVTILDISARGAKLALPKAVETGASSRLRVAGQDVYCTIIWANANQCGLQFEHNLPKPALEEILATSSEQTVPVACTHYIARGRRREGRLVMDNFSNEDA